MNLETRVSVLAKHVRNATARSVDAAVTSYNAAYERHPMLTNYVSQAIGVIGGDVIAKCLVDNKPVRGRDLAFTAAASVYQAWLYPKLLPWTKQLVESTPVDKVMRACRVDSYWANAIALTVLFFPLNMLYWSILCLKNEVPISSDSLRAGAITIAQASVPYLGVDYVVANKLDKKYALPTWSSAELGWNSFVALKNYLRTSVGF